jgi:hypothetical protein
MKYKHPGLEQIRIAVDKRNREHAELVSFQESPTIVPTVRKACSRYMLEQMVSAEGIEPSTY